MHLSVDWTVLAIAIALVSVAVLLFPPLQNAAVRLLWGLFPLPKDQVNRDLVVASRAAYAYRRGWVELAREVSRAHSTPRHVVHALHRDATATNELSDQDQWRLGYNRERSRANELLAAGDMAAYQELADRLNNEARQRGLQ